MWGKGWKWVGMCVRVSSRPHGAIWDSLQTCTNRGLKRPEGHQSSELAHTDPINDLSYLALSFPPCHHHCSSGAGKPAKPKQQPAGSVKQRIMEKMKMLRKKR